MRVSRSLPEGFVLAGTVRLRGNRRLLLTLNLLSAPLWIASCYGFTALSSLVRPGGWTFDFRDVSPPAILAVAIGGGLATIVVTIVLHEAVHGAALWWYTRTRPVFGFRGWYAYADAPGFFFARGPMLAVLVAPLIVMPAIGVPLMAVTPPAVSLFVLVGLVINTVAAVGDLYMVGLALRIKGPVYFGDGPDDRTGESGSWFVPAAATP
jgi:hypothetical protein